MGGVAARIVPPSALLTRLYFPWEKKRVRSNLSLAFCCCFGCGYSVSLALQLSRLRALCLSLSRQFGSLQRLVFLLFLLFCPSLCESRIFVLHTLLRTYTHTLTHSHTYTTGKVSHIVRAYQKLIYPHTFPGMWHVACGNAAFAFVMKSKLTNFFNNNKSKQCDQLSVVFLH